jgi:hypothetical protein
LICGLFCQYLYSKGNFEVGVDPRWPLTRFYQPFWADKFFKMVISLKLLEKQAKFVGCFPNICIQKAILYQEAIQNDLYPALYAISS